MGVYKPDGGQLNSKRLFLKLSVKWCNGVKHTEKSEAQVRSL